MTILTMVKQTQTIQVRYLNNRTINYNKELPVAELHIKYLHVLHNQTLIKQNLKGRKKI